MQTLEEEKDLLLSAAEFMQLLKDQGMVIGPRTVFEKKTVKGVPFEEYRRRILKKNMISFGEISRAELWGQIGAKQAKNIGLEHLPESDLALIDGRYKIPRQAVKSIAFSRGFEI